MKIKPFFVVFCLFLIVAQKVIFSDAIFLLSEEYPLMVFIYPLIILALPLDFDKPLLLLFAFLLGLFLDVINDTLGIGAFSLVMMAYLRSSILTLIQPRQGYKGGDVLLKSYGIGWVTIYIGLSLLIYAFAFFMIDAFTMVFFKRVVISTLMSTIVSLPFGIFILMIFRRG
jgi:hypothetical protein